MNNKPKNHDLELLPEIILQRDCGPGRCRSERSNYADINLILRRKTHKRQSLPAVVPIQIDSNPSRNSCLGNRKITKMELALELELSRKRLAACVN